jgi:Tfp pilus assembly protein PilF
MALATRPPSSTQPQPDPDLQTGLQYLRAGWFDRAEPLFRSALGRHGERPDILHFLAVCLSQRGALSEAEALWRKALAKDPNEPMLSYNLGLVARRQGRLDEAARRFRDTVRRSPAHVEARLALASIYMDLNRFAAAERELIEFVTNVDQGIQQGARACSGFRPSPPCRPGRATCWAMPSTASATIPRRSRSSTRPQSMPGRMARGAPRSWATARWR